MSKIYVVGDIHANFKGLVQAIERSPFNSNEDTLVSLGDLVDGGTQSYEVVEFLSSLPNCILIKGNHDEWFKHWLHYGINPVAWLQGQHLTAQSYIEYVKREFGEERKLVPDNGGYKCNLTYLDIPVKHRLFLNTAVNYYIDANNNCYVHGGFNRHLKIDEQQTDDIYYWDRDLWSQALTFRGMDENMSIEEWESIYGKKYKPTFKMKDTFNSIFIGHTTTMNWKTTKPMKAVNIYNIDTGAGFAGKVTIMDTETKEYWQSDTVAELYGQPFHR